MARMRASFVLFIGFVALAGCARAVISDLETDKVIVQGNNEGLAHAEARKGCAIHGRTPVAISFSCLDQYCITKQYLFACKDGGVAGSVYGGSSALQSGGHVQGAVLQPDGSVSNPQNQRSGETYRGEGTDACGEPWSLRLTINAATVFGALTRGTTLYEIVGEFDARTGIGSGRMGKSSTSSSGPRLITYSFSIDGQENFRGDFAIDGINGKSCETPFKLS